MNNQLDPKQLKFTILATDVIIFTIKDNDLKVLLTKMKKEPYIGMWAAPGGLVSPTESITDAAIRHLYSKTGVDNVYLEQLYTFGDIKRDPDGRVVSVAYFALVSHDLIELKLISEAEWFSIKNLPELAYDHKEMIATALERLKSKIEYTNVVFSLLPEEFTLTELQKVYETILDKNLDKRNFRRKMLSLNLLIELKNHTKMGGAHRPAKLYKFKKKTLQFIEIL